MCSHVRFFPGSRLVFRNSLGLVCIAGTDLRQVIPECDRLSLFVTF